MLTVIIAVIGLLALYMMLWGPELAPLCLVMALAFLGAVLLLFRV